MKQLRYIVAVAISAMALASCSTDEVVSSYESPAQAISFKAMANKSTRADNTVKKDNLDFFRVWGCNMTSNTVNNHVQSFQNVVVSKVEDSDPIQWTYPNTQYWAPNRDYYFVALSTNNEVYRTWKFTVPSSHETGFDQTNFKGYGEVEMSLIEALEDEGTPTANQDLICAYAVNATGADMSNTPTIDFTFNHMLSRVALKFQNNFKNQAYSFKISAVELTLPVTRATCKLGNTETDYVWTATADSKAAAVKVGMPSTFAAWTDQNGAMTAGNVNSSATDPKFIFPGDQVLGIKFTVTIYLSGVFYSTRTLTGTIASNTYEMGYSYMLTATIDETNINDGGNAYPIEFNVEGVNSWGAWPDTDHEQGVTIITTPSTDN